MILHMRPPFSMMKPEIAKPGKRYHKMIILHEALFFRDAA